MDELYIIQKNRFSEFHSYYSKFLNYIKSTEKMDNKTLYKILELNSNMNQLISSLMDIEHDFIKDDENYVDKFVDYKENEAVFKKFMPLIFAYKMALQESNK